MKKQSGFTLVELMVAMAILAILATAGLSAYTGYLKKARDTTRIADLRAINSIVLASLSTGGQPPATIGELATAISAANNGKAIGDPLGGKSVCLSEATGDTLGTCNYTYSLCDGDSGYQLTAKFESKSNTQLYTTTGGSAEGYHVGSCTANPVSGGTIGGSSGGGTATLYFCNTTDGNWDTTDNWHTASDCSDSASLPAAGDTVIMADGASLNSGPSIPIQPASVTFNDSGSNTGSNSADLSAFTNLVIFNDYSYNDYGTLTTAEFNGNSKNNYGTVDTAEFNDSSYNTGTVTTATFNGYNANFGTVTTATFNGTSFNGSNGTVDTAEFNGDSFNGGTVTTAEFNGISSNYGTITTATFNGSSSNGSNGSNGTITTATFNGTSFNGSNGTVDTAEFNGDSFNGGTITTATFNDTSDMSGGTADTCTFNNPSNYTGGTCTNCTTSSSNAVCPL